jgi:D-alanyl-D-alanine carboxypeptidase (penicillin-binding protein 5/6)
MRTHNHLLKQLDGCDGYKTGYFTKAGFSIAATAKRGGVRIIAIVMGSKNRKVRDAKAIELINKGFAMVPQQAEPAVQKMPVKTTVIPKTMESNVSLYKQAEPEALKKATGTEKKSSAGWGKFFVGIVLGFCLYAAFDFIKANKQRKRKWRLK